MSLPAFKLRIPLAHIDPFHRALYNVWGGGRKSLFDAPFIDELNEKLLCSATRRTAVVVKVPHGRLPLLGLLLDAMAMAMPHGLSPEQLFIGRLVCQVWQETHLTVVDQLGRLA